MPQVEIVAPIAETQLPRIVWHEPRPKGISHPGGFIPPDQIATGDQVVAALRDSKARGCIGMVLTVDSLGGEAAACTAVFDAIRDFSREAGPVVAFISGHAVSSAVHWALAADFVVMAPGATYQVHAAVPFDGDQVAGDELYASDAARCVNEWQAATIQARAAETPTAVAQALAAGAPRQRLQLPASVALHFGWADAIGDASVAWGLLTALLERGQVPPSRRRRFLATAQPGQAKLPSARGLAMVGIAEDGVTVVDLTGGTDITNFHAITANNSAAVGWGEVNGYVQGRAATGTALGTPDAPGKMHQDARYVRLAVTFNSAAGDGVQDLDALEFSVMANENAIEDGAITFSKIAADSLRTSNYTEDGSGNPTAGAKMDKTGTALKVAAGNLQVGTRVLSEAWFLGQTHGFVQGLTYNSGWTQSGQHGLVSKSWDSGTKTLTLTFDAPGGTAYVVPLFRNASALSLSKYLLYVSSITSGGGQITVSVRLAQETSFGTYSTGLDWTTISSVLFDMALVSASTWS